MSEIRDLIFKWDSLYPIDKWWRDKYKIPFGSKKHRNQCLLDMRIEYEEEIMFIQLDREDQKKNKEKEKYYPGRGVWLNSKKPKMTQEEIDRDFERLTAMGAHMMEEKKENGKTIYKF